MHSNDFREEGWMSISDLDYDVTISNGEVVVTDTEDRSDDRS